MRIDEFVSTALEQIVSGICEAQRAVDADGARINPQAETGQATEYHTHTVVQNIEFDLAVTVQKSGKTGGELGVSVWAVKAGTGGASETQNTTANRIRFRVPVVFPRHDLTIKREATGAA